MKHIFWFVDKLMEKAGEPKPEKKSSGIELILKDIGIGVILLLVIGSLIYINFFSDSKNLSTKLFSF